MLPLLPFLTLPYILLMTIPTTIATTSLITHSLHNYHPTANHDLKILSFNVRYDSKPDNISVRETLDSLPQGLPPEPGPGEYYGGFEERPWSTRRIGVAGVVGREGVGVFGGQELLHRQVLDVQELLGEQWGWIGVGREDGGEKGEYSPIFYRKDLYHPVSNDTFWLTSTPFEVSKFPDAGSRRICTVVRFSIVKVELGSAENQVKAGGVPDFTILNTHFDDQSAGQRQLGASLILHRAKYEAIKTRRPVILTGDFNSPPHDTAYRTIVGDIAPLKLNSTFVQRYSWDDNEEKGFEDFVLKDLLGETPAHKRLGNYATFTDFKPIGDTTAYERLDYILVGNSAGWTAETYHVGSNMYDDGVYASDHRPVMASIQLGKVTTQTETRLHQLDTVREEIDKTYIEQTVIGN